MIQSFDQFLSTSAPNISVFTFVVNLLFAAVLSTALKYVYKKFGDSLSNREQFGKNFMLITMTTMLIITIVKSSLALSLGLVGALSIIRFRAAIKEPEELAYLFLAISIGLGLGANQTAITIIAFLIICTLIVISKRRSFRSEDRQNLFITVQAEQAGKELIKNIIDTLKTFCLSVDMKRFDEAENSLEIVLHVEVKDFDTLYEAKLALQSLGDKIKVSFLDNKGII